MNNIKVNYTLEYNNKIWTVWRNKEGNHSIGCIGIYHSSSKNDCIEYCKNKGIVLKNDRKTKK